VYSRDNKKTYIVLSDQQISLLLKSIMSEKEISSIYSTSSKNKDTFLLAQQMGVGFKDGNARQFHPANAQKGYEKFASDELAISEELPFKLNEKEKIESLLGISELIGELRQLLFNNDITDFKRNEEIRLNPTMLVINDFLQEIFKPNNTHDSRLNIIEPNKDNLSIIFASNPKILNKYVENQERILLLLELLDNDKTNDYSNAGDGYKQHIDILRHQLEVWREVLENLLPNAIDNDQYQKLRDSYRSKFDEKEKERLKKLITGERGGDKVRIRTINTLLGSTSTDKRNEVVDDFYDEFLNTAMAVNEIRTIYRLEKEGIDISNIRKKIIYLKDSYKKALQDPENKDRKIKEINEELKELLIPIANTVHKIFKHNSTTALTAVLTKNQAGCAGKVNVLSTVMDFLGINSNSCVVTRTLNDNSQDHVVLHDVLEVPLFGDKKLIIDANYSSFHELRDEDKDKMTRLQLILKANEGFIPDSSNILVYEISSRRDDGCNQPFSYVLPQDDKGEWFANIPYPHKSIFPDRRNSRISSSVYNNLATLFKLFYQDDERAKMYASKSKDINPHGVGIVGSFL